MSERRLPATQHKPLYTAEQRRRRDQSGWTLVQGVLAPVQFAIFLVSLSLVLRFLLTGAGETAATVSVVVKTLALYTIMITGSIWEKVVFGRISSLRRSSGRTRSACSCSRCTRPISRRSLSAWLDARDLMVLALAAYAAYVVNATQFLLKLRAARLEAGREARSA